MIDVVQEYQTHPTILNRNKAIEAYYNFVQKYITKHYYNHPDLPDLIHEGVFGLIEALKKYDITRTKQPFEVFAGWCIRRRLFNNRVKIQDENDAIQLFCISKKPAPPSQEWELLKNEVGVLMHQVLTSNEYNVLNQRLISNDTIKQIAKTYKVTENAIDKLKQKAINKLIKICQENV